MEDTGRHLDFVLKHYRKGALDTRRAIRRFNAATSFRAGRRKVRTLWLSVISSAAAVAAGVIVYMNTGSRAWTENVTAGAVQVCILPDSTSVTLAPGSSVCYRNGRAFLRHRKVKLEGMAFFRVTKDAAHPFVVSSENAYVKVLGTEFQVEEIPGTGNTTCTEVSVRSGKVFFSRTPESKGLVLVRDMSASLGPGETIPVLTNHAPMHLTPRPGLQEFLTMKTPLLMWCLTNCPDITVWHSPWRKENRTGILPEVSMRGISTRRYS